MSGFDAESVGDTGGPSASSDGGSVGSGEGSTQAATTSTTGDEPSSADSSDGSDSSDDDTTSGGADPTDNPDGYAPVVQMFRCGEYDSEEDDPPFELLDIAALEHQPVGGWQDSGAWQLTPHPIPGAVDDNEGLAGWKWWPEAGIPPGSAEVLVVSYMLLLSPQFVVDVSTQNYPDPNYGVCKIIDLQMWNDGADSADFDTRQIVQMVGWRDPDQGLDAGGIYLAHVNGGAGGRYANDGVNVPLNLAERPGEWVWIAHVFDARPGQEKTTTYYKREGDVGVTRSLVRPGELDFLFAGHYEYTAQGWAAPPEYNSALWGYWGDISLPADATRYLRIDRMCSGDGWIDPPF